MVRGGHEDAGRGSRKLWSCGKAWRRGESTTLLRSKASAG